MTQLTTARETAKKYGQEQVFRFVEELDDAARERLAADVAGIDFKLMARLIDKWVLSEPAPETFDDIRPVPVIARNGAAENWKEARDAGEEALRAGRVGLFLVAGGQGTRLGFDGPKGAYPIGPITGKTLFEYHSEKIRAYQKRYGCTLSWYIMVSAANARATKAFFEGNDYFGLNAANVMFLQQRMVPCVDDAGKFMLERPDKLAKNPNGHGGCIPAMVENGVLDDARERGVDLLSYFQVDNWAIKLADPLFIGHHVLGQGEMSSKVHRKNAAREAVGVHCLCDGEYRIIEYSELDLYPQLLETDSDGGLKHYAGNPAIHMMSVGFVQRVYDKFDAFPWHRAHKKIPYVDEAGNRVEPEEPNGYKFETFVFDALRFVNHAPLCLEIARDGEYTPIKQYEGANSVINARKSQARYWAEWLRASGEEVPRDPEGQPTVTLEVSPLFALDQEEFVVRSEGADWPVKDGLAVDADGLAQTAGN